MLKNTESTYGALAKLFHWGIAFFVGGLLVVGFTMEDAPSEWRGTIYGVHKSIGLLVLILMVVRLWWRAQNVQPALPSSLPLWQKRGAHLVHYLLYISLFLMPISGWCMSVAAGRVPSFFWLFPVDLPFVPRDKELAGVFAGIHEVSAYILLVLLLFHIGAAIKHHFFDKADILKRML